MPNVASAKKRLRQNIKARERNRAARSAMRSFMRKVREASEAQDRKAAEENLAAAMKWIGKNSKKHIIPPARASRLAARLQQHVNKAFGEHV